MRDPCTNAYGGRCNALVAESHATVNKQSLVNNWRGFSRWLVGGLMSGRMPVASRQLLIVHRDPTTNKKINSVHLKLGLCAASTLINFFLIDLISSATLNDS